MWVRDVLSKVLTHIQLAEREDGEIAPIPIVVEFEWVNQGKTIIMTHYTCAVVAYFDKLFVHQLYTSQTRRLQ
jgi:hypothetical protein